MLFNCTVCFYIFLCVLLVYVSSAAGSSSIENQQHIVTEDQEETDASRSGNNLFNFASATAGAVILDSAPPSAKGYHNLLNNDKDKYSISPCSEAKRYVVVGLSEDIQITSVSLANYERYSSLVKDFQLFASGSYPTPEWIFLGNYTAEPKLGEQVFNITQLSTSYTRYLRIKFLTHYLDEALCTLSQVKVHGLTIIASLKQEVELAQDHFDILQKLNQEEKAKMATAPAVPENQTTPVIPAPATPDHAPAADSSAELTDSSRLVNTAGGEETTKEDNGSSAELLPDGVADSRDDSVSSVSVPADVTAEDAPQLPGDIVQATQSDSAVSSPEASSVHEVCQATVETVSSAPAANASAEAHATVPSPGHDPQTAHTVSVSPDNLQPLPIDTQAASDVESVEASESANVVYSALQEMHDSSFNASATPANSSTLQKLQDLIFSGSSIFKQLKLSPSQMGMLDSFVSFVHSQRDAQASKEDNTSSSFAPSNNNSHHENNTSSATGQVSVSASSADAGNSTEEHLPDTAASTSVGLQVSGNSSNDSDTASLASSAVPDPIPLVQTSAVVEMAGIVVNETVHIQDSLAAAAAPSPDQSPSVLDISKQPSLPSPLPDLFANKSSNIAEESRVPSVPAEHNPVNATDAASPSTPLESSSNTSLSDTAALVANQTVNATAASAASANLSSLTSFNCHDMMTFAEFQSKTLAKLSNKTEEYSGSSGFATLNKDHNVFRALMQRIKNLEMNYILSEMYISQMSECMKAMSKEHQALLVKHQEPSINSSQRTQPVADGLIAADDSDILLPLLPAAIEAAQTSLIYVRVPRNSSSSSQSSGSGAASDNAAGEAPWVEMLNVAVANVLKVYRQMLLRLPLVNGHSVVQIALQAVLKLNKEYTLEIWSLFIISIVAACTLVWTLIIALVIGLFCFYFKKRQSAV